MVKGFFRLIFRLKGWKIGPCPAEASNCIILAAPHTSNWDFIYALAALDMMNLNVRFTIKKEFNKFPLGSLISSLGALWVDRSPDTSGIRPGMTEIMKSFFRNEKDKMAVLVTAEGTRSPVTKWRTGFYYAAVGAKVPICLSYLDYKKKEAGIGICIYPTGNIEKDMTHIMDFYKDKTARFPEKFKLDKRFS